MKTKDIKGITKVAIYSRKSKFTDKGESIKVQIKMCKEYFPDNGEYSFVVYEDEGYSGGNINRPAYNRMMEAIKRNEIDIVICYKIDRIARNIIDFFDTYKIFEKYNVRLISRTEGFDASTPMGKIVMTMLAGFADMERMNIKERVKDNMLNLAIQGKWTGGNAPVGYKSERVMENGKKCSYLVKDLSKESIVKDIYSLYIDGYGTKKISKEIKDKYKISCCQKRVLNILSSPTYVNSSEYIHKYLKSIGFEVYGDPNGNAYLTYQKTYATNSGKKLTDKVNPTIAAVSRHEGIVTEEAWIRVNEKLRAYEMEPKPRKSQYTFLAHKVICGYCNAPMNVYGDMSTTGEVCRYFRKTCKCNHIGEVFRNSRLTVEKAEDKIKIFMSQISNIDSINDYIKTNDGDEKYEIEIKSKEKEIKKIDKFIDGLTENMALASKKVASVLSQKLEGFIEEKEKIQNEILGIERKLSDVTMRSENKKLMCNTAKKFIELYDQSDIEDKRRDIELVIDKILWKGREQELAVKLLEL